MKKLLLFFSLAFVSSVFSQNWVPVSVPSDIVTYNSNNNHYIVDYYGQAYAIYTYTFSGNSYLNVDKYDQLPKTWSNIYNELLPGAADTIKTDNLGGEVVFSFISKQTPTPEVRVYQIVSGSVINKVTQNMPDFQPYTQYDFKMGNNTDEFYWFISDNNGTDKSFMSYNSGTGLIDRYPIPQLTSVYPTNLQMQQVGDTLWFACGVLYSDCRLIKTHESTISFGTWDGSAQGKINALSYPVMGHNITLLSNRIDRFTLSGHNSNSTLFEYTFVDGVQYITNNPGDYFPAPYRTADSYSSDKVAAIGNFSPDGSNQELKVLEKTYSTDSWVELGQAGSTVFKNNDYNVGNVDISYSQYADKYLISYDSVGYYMRNLKILNHAPDTDSIVANVEPYVCHSNSNNLFTELSFWDANNDSMQIISITSSDQSVLPDANISFSSTSKTLKRQFFDVDGTPLTDGTTTLTIMLTDGLDTLSYNSTITIAPLNVTSSVSGSSCGPGSPLLDVTIPAGNVYWYDTDASTILQTTTGVTQFITPYITSTSTFYAQAYTNGCFSPLEPVNAVIYVLPTVNAGSDQTICFNSLVTLSGSGSGGVVYTWDNGISDGVAFNATSMNTYTLTGTDANGCTNTDQVDVYINSLPSVDAGVDQDVCIGNSVTLNGSGAISYSWDNGVSDGVSFSPGSTQTYTLTGTDGNGCTNTDQVVVNVNALPSVSITPSGATTFCLGGSVDLTATSASGYMWSDGSVVQTITVNAGGTFSVTITDANGCQNTSSSVNVIVNALPSVSAGGDATVCYNDVVTLAGTGAQSYSWDNGITNNVPFNASITTTYTVTGTDANGCQNTDQVDINVNSLPVIDGGFDQAVCSGTSIVLAANGGISYSWNNGITDNVSFTPSSSGTYIVNGTDFNGCINKDTVLVTVYTIPSVSITASGATVFCSGGSVDLTASSASSYSWSDGSTAQVLNVTSTGNYSVTITDANGCQNTSNSTFVFVMALPSVSAGSDQTVCAGTPVTLSGSGTSSYSWDNGVVNGVSFTPSSTLTYTVTGTDGNGCQNTDQVDVTVHALPLVDAGMDQTVCAGTNVAFSASGANNYSWDNGITDGLSFVASSTTTYTVTGTDLNGCVNTDQVNLIVNALPSATITPSGPTTFCSGASVDLTASTSSGYLWSESSLGQTITVGSSGSYFVTVTDGNGCQNTSAAVNVVVNPLPSVSAGSDITVCQNGSVTLSGSGAQVYTWDNGALDNVSFSAASSLTYTVTGTDANGCSNTDQMDLFVNALPAVDAGLDQTVCDGTSVSFSGTGAQNYSWDNGISDGVNFTATATTTFTVTGTDANGCVNTDQAVLTVNALPTVFVTPSGPTTFCAGGSVDLTVNNAASYLWSDASLGQTITVTSSGYYSVAITDANGCQGFSGSIPVTVNALPAVDAGIDQTVCLNDPIILHGNGAATYSWDNGVTDSIPFPAVSNLTYTVTGTDANGCTNTDQLDVFVNSLPIVDAGSDQTVCDGTTIILTGSGASSYSWDNGIGNGVSFVANSTATYTVVGTDLNGCSNSDQVLITVNPLPSAIISHTGQPTFCAGGSIDLTSSAGVSYLWSESSSTSMITVTTSGNYTVTVTDANGCQNTSAPLVVTVNPLPIVDAGMDQSVCETSSITLNGSGAQNYSWDNGVSDGVPFVPSATSTYTVTGTDINGCVNTDIITLTVVPLPTLNTNTAVEICQYNELNLSASSSSPFIFWYDQANAGNIISSGDTYYSNEIFTDSIVYVGATENGCSTPRTAVQVTVNPNPTVSLNAIDADCNSANGSISATISNGTAPFSYYWSNGEQQVLAISNLNPGSYYFNVEDSKGCKALGVTNIVPAAVTFTPTIINPSCHDLNNGSISVAVSGITENFFYLWNTGSHQNTVSNLLAGTYEVSIYTESGCVFSSSYTLTQPDALVNEVVQQKPTCGSNDGQLSIVSTIGGNPGYLYDWGNGQFGLVNNNLTFGVYTLTTTDNNGCTKQEVFYLSEAAGPSIIGTVIESSCNGNDGSIDADVTPQIGDFISTISWSNGATTEDINNIPKGNYICQAVSGSGCTSIKGWDLNGQKPLTQEICVVSVDSVTTTNLIVWEKVQSSGVAWYNIYRESNQAGEYQLIDTVQYSNLSVFNDVVASPQARAWRYRISAVDYCGVEGDLSLPHKTLHLNVEDMAGTDVKIFWDEYEGNPFSSYVLKRYTDQFGWEDLVTLPTSTLSYIDPISISTPGLDYMVEISLDVPCTATTWRAQDFNRSRSNKDRGIFAPGHGDEEYSNNDLYEIQVGNSLIEVYPNPFNSKLEISLDGDLPEEISLMSLHGQIIQHFNLKNGNNVFDLSHLENGVYLIRILDNKQMKTIRIVKN